MSTARPPEGAQHRSPQSHQSRALRWTIGVGLAAMTGIGLVLLFLLTQATNNRDLYERNYARLFTLNVVVASLLLLVIGWIVVRLLVRLRLRLVTRAWRQRRHQRYQIYRRGLITARIF